MDTCTNHPGRPAMYEVAGTALCGTCMAARYEDETEEDEA